MIGRLDLEPHIRSFEADRSSGAILGAAIAFLPGLTLFLIALIVFAIMAIGDDDPSVIIGQLFYAAFAIIAILFIGILVSGIFVWVRARFRRTTYLVIVTLLSIMACLSALDPLRVARIEAQGADAIAIRDELLQFAVIFMLISIVLYLIWIHDFIRYGILMKANRTHCTANAIKAGVSDIFSLPRTYWQNRRHLIVLLPVAVLATAAFTPLRVALPGAMSSNFLGVLHSPYAMLKFNLGSMNQNCGVAGEIFSFPARVTECAVRGEGDMFVANNSAVRQVGFLLTHFALLGIVGLMLGRWCVKRSAILYQRDAPEDPRSPILYLRPFREDLRPLAWRPRLLSSLFLPCLGEPRSIDEVVLSGACEDGPVLAIGRPGEQIPPLGAARVYVEGNDWQTVVASLAAKAKYIVLVVDPTPGVLWEIEQTKAQGWAKRTLYLFTSLQTREQRWAAMSEVLGYPCGPSSATAFPIALHVTDGEWQVMEAHHSDRFAVQTALDVFRARQDALSLPA